MAKIRDLGINVVPATMRPPEVGRGGGFEMAVPHAIEYQMFPGVETCGCTDLSPQCEPHSNCVQTQCAQGSRAPNEAAVLSHEAVAQLKHQLRNYIGTEMAN